MKKQMTPAEQIKSIYLSTQKAGEAYKALTDSIIGDIKKNGCFETARSMFKNWPTNDKAKLMGSTESNKFAMDTNCKPEIKTIINAVNAYCVWYSRNKNLFMTEEEKKQAEIAKKRREGSRAAKEGTDNTNTNKKSSTADVKQLTIGEVIQFLESQNYRVLELVEYNRIISEEKQARESFQNSRETIKALKERIKELETAIAQKPATTKKLKAVANA